MSNHFAILAGYRDDIESIASGLPEGSCFSVDEHTPDSCPLPRAKIAIYVFSADTGYSSQLLSWFTWIHSSVRAANEYVVVLGDAEVQKKVFHFARDLLVVSSEDARRILARSSDDAG